MTKIFLILAILAGGAASYIAYENKQAYSDVLAANGDVIKKLEKLKRDNSAEVTKIDNAKADLSAAEDARNEVEARRNLKRENLGKRTAAISATRTELGTINTEIQELNTVLGGLDLPSPEALNTELEEASGKKLEMEQAIEEQSSLASTLRTSINDKRGVLASLRKSLADQAANFQVKSRRAQISAVDPEWGFAVINTGNTNGINPNDRVIVERGGQRVGMLIVKTVEPSKIVANLVPEAGPSVQPGDTVIFEQQNEG